MLSAYVHFHNPSVNLGKTFLYLYYKQKLKVFGKKKILKIFAHNTFSAFMVVIK